MQYEENISPSCFSLLVYSQPMVQLAQAQQPAFQDDELTPELFSLILKDEWTYLREATDQLLQGNW